jgi:hypothetical protein
LCLSWVYWCCLYFVVFDVGFLVLLVVCVFGW